jgi:hypothetical protein
MITKVSLVTATIILIGLDDYRFCLAAYTSRRFMHKAQVSYWKIYHLLSCNTCHYWIGTPNVHMQT